MIPDSESTKAENTTKHPASIGRWDGRGRTANRPQWSLRKLMAAVTLISLIFGVAINLRSRIASDLNHEQAIADGLRRTGSKVTLNLVDSGWIDQLAGFGQQMRITEIRLRKLDPSKAAQWQGLPAVMTAENPLPRLKRLVISKRHLLASDCEWISGLPSLEELVLSDVHVTDDAVSLVRSSQSLRVLFFENGIVTGKCLRSLASIAALKRILLTSWELERL